jgi:hypothetical protein
MVRSISFESNTRPGLVVMKRRRELGARPGTVESMSMLAKRYFGPSSTV